MASEFVSYVGRLISVRSVVQLYPGPLVEPHTHTHVHEALTHVHPHFPDIHHRHGHV